MFYKRHNTTKIISSYDENTVYKYLHLLLSSIDVIMKLFLKGLLLSLA